MGSDAHHIDRACHVGGDYGAGVALAVTSEQRRTAYVFMAVAIAIGSFSFTIIKVLLEHLSPITMAAGRVVFSASAFVVVVVAQPRRRRPIDRSDRVRLVLCGFLGSAVFHILFAWGQQRASVAVGAVIMGSMPALVAFGEAAVLRHRLTSAQWLGVGLSTVGIAVIATGSGSGSSESTWAGVIALAGAVTAWAAVTLLMRSFDGKYDESWLNAPGAVLGAAVACVAAGPKLAELADLSAWSWVLLVWMGVVSSAFIYVAMGKATVALSGTTAASLGTLVTPAGILIAWVVLGERPTVRAVIGAAAVIAGVLAVSGRSRRQSAARSLA